MHAAFPWEGRIKRRISEGRDPISIVQDGERSKIASDERFGFAFHHLVVL